jgi:hypothetical protein
VRGGPSTLYAKRLASFFHLEATSKLYGDEISPDRSYPVTQMTRLTIAEDPGEEFAVRAHNTLTDSYDDEVIFYSDVTKVHVVPERESFTIQVITPDLVLEMDFTDADSIREALALFEAKKVLAVDFQVQKAVRLTPTSTQETILGTPFEPGQ